MGFGSDTGERRFEAVFLHRRRAKTTPRPPVIYVKLNCSYLPHCRATSCADAD
jgi:hypothetical protein